MNIFIGNLHYDVNEDELREFFEEYGEVISSKVVKDRETGRSRGFGFVEMSNETEARKAIEELNGAEVEGRSMVVNESIPKPKNNNNNRRGGGFNSGGRRRDSHRNY